MDDVSRFVEKVDRSQGPAACWPWKAATNGVGYGVFRLSKPRRQVYAHRVAYFLATEVDPVELCVCHKCDNPKCCNPEHLWLGTKGDNLRDAITKGRHQAPPISSVTGDANWQRQRPQDLIRGQAHHRAKLSDEDVIAIRASCRAGVGQKSLAKRYGVARCTITRISTGETWAHLKTET